MKFNWEYCFTSICTVSGFAAAAVTLCFVFGQIRGCTQAGDVQSKEMSIARTQALSKCIETTQKVFECREVFR